MLGPEPAAQLERGGDPAEAAAQDDDACAAHLSTLQIDLAPRAPFARQGNHPLHRQQGADLGLTQDKHREMFTRARQDSLSSPCPGKSGA